MEAEVIRKFIERWQNRGDEKSDTQKFWLDFLQSVCDVEEPLGFIEFEKRVELDHVSFIDAYIPSTRVIIEQKSLNVSLDKATQQSDGTLKTPFEQAKRYSDWLPDSMHARWIVTCNFAEFQIHDMEKPKAEPEIVKLDELSKHLLKFQFLIDSNAAKPKDIHEAEISIQAGELVGKLYEALLARYKNPDSADSLRSLNILCVRIVFLLFAEDVGIVDKSAFHDYMLAHKDASRRALMDLFVVLSQKPENRDPYTAPDLAVFPYVNGGLFEDKSVEIPLLDGEPFEIILHDMSESFDWSQINPPIFGAIFESTLNKDTRKQGGMHYTTLENIHKVIDPLFLDKLKHETDELLQRNPLKTELQAFRKKLSTYKFFDPACGSGNFLTESYLSLCKLEMKIIQALGELPFHHVSINQFYGIEINDFAVSVAKTALWIADIQMSKKVNPKADLPRECLPLENYDNIREGNALTTNWRDIIEPSDNVYIMGNPPFMGYSNQTKEQKQDLLSVYVDEAGKPYKAAGKIDYVAGWYFKAAEFMAGTTIRAAFVSTNSITQGEQVSGVFKPLKERFNAHIDFAHQTFKWNSEARDKAQVHVVIIGCSTNKSKEARQLYSSDGRKISCRNINFYLVPGNDVFIEPRKETLSDDAPTMRRGSQPTDNGNLLMTLEERDALLKANPSAKKFIRPFMMGVDFIQRKPRYCLWLVGANPDDIAKCPKVMERIKRVKEFRLSSKKEATRRKAETPTLFDERVEMSTNYIAIPKTSSGERYYIPMDWLPPEVIPGDELRVIPDATLYHFGVLTSRVHMAWTRRVAGRFGTGYRYTNTIVYNNFPWPSQKTSGQFVQKFFPRIESTAQKILDARALYHDSSFASLYNDNLMPPELRKAHRANDAAVCEAYGWEKNISEEEIVTRLIEMYEEYI